ncbi:MAG: TIGR04076 family protein [Thermoplasmata archaeon]
MLEIVVKEVRGTCPVHRTGDKMVIEGPRLVLDETDAVCVHALSTILHYVPALEKGVDPLSLGLAKEKGVAYMQCVDPGNPYTEGGTVIFECRKTA